MDEATNLAVRAASGIASSLSSFGSSQNHAASLGLGIGGGGTTMKLSRQRIERLREQATQKLSRAYHLDEIACSVATMQSASALEDVARLVLQRKTDDVGAKYVHFFHEKIPSRQLAESTSLRPLDEVIAERPTDPEPLRTRATVRVFKEDHVGAAADLTTALQVLRLYRPHKNVSQSQDLQLYDRKTRRQEITLEEDQQPSSLEIQLLFQRAGVYLTMACQHVPDALAEAPIQKDGEAIDQSNGSGAVDTEEEPGTLATDGPPPVEMTAEDKAAQKRLLEARKAVKTNAKKALRDYLAFLSNFDYSPNLPVDITEEFTRKVNSAAYGGARQPRYNSQDSPNGDKPHAVYALSELFSATPPADLPPYPSTDLVIPAPASQSDPTITSSTTTETLTYHPLLTDALHSVLLCHSLIQTSSKELLRHSYMVARLARLADGYPIFQASRSPARSDWMEVLRKSSNWLPLSGTWESLCAPAPLPMFHSASSQSNGSPSPNGMRPAKALPAPDTAPVEDQQREKERRHHKAILEALEDERVHDEASFRAAIHARQKRAESDSNPPTPTVSDNGQLDSLLPVLKAPDPTSMVESPSLLPAVNGDSKTATPTNGNSLAIREKEPRNGTAAHPTAKRWATNDGREYPILTERAAAVARWVREAPAGAGATGSSGKRKKKSRKVAAPLSASTSALEASAVESAVENAT